MAQPPDTLKDKPAEAHDPYAALRIPAFRRLLIGGQFVMIGTAGQSVAIGYEMYQRTKDPLALGLVGLVQAIPMLVLTLPSGYLADVLDRRKLIVASMILTSATSVGLAAFSYWQGPIAVMYLLLFFDSCALRLGWPARSALMPLIVPASAFENSVKWRTSLGRLSAMVGPAVGGFIVAWSTPAAYLISAASTVGMIFVLLSIDVPQGRRVPPGNMLRRVREGIHFVWAKKVVLGAISLDLFAVLLGGAVFLLPLYAEEYVPPILGMSTAQSLGWLRAAPAAGALVTALILAHMPPMRKAGRTLLLAVAGFGAATIVFGLSRNFWLSMAMLAMTGAMDNISVVVRHTLVQLSTPNEMRGRVSAVNSMFITGSNELGGFESGLVGKLFNPVVSVVSGGVGTIVVVLAWARLFPSLAKVGRLAEVDASSETTPLASPPGVVGADLPDDSA